MQATAIKVVKKLQQAGFEAYFAGGAVRDMLLKREIKDIDIATNAKPDEVEKLFENTKPVGKEFGVILVVEDKIAFEVATFRSDIGTDTRRPQRVEFTSAEKDAERRDFSINGLFYDPLKKKMIDFVEGQEDLEKKVLRFIGDAQNRIDEDYLRILRAIRFKNILGFEYAQGIEGMLQENSQKILEISVERVREELDKMLSDKSRANSLENLDKLGLLKHILPEVWALKNIAQSKPYHTEGDAFRHTMMALDSLDDGVDLDLGWAVLLHDIGKQKQSSVRQVKKEIRISFHGHVKASAEMAEKIMKRLKFSRERMQKIIWLIRHHDDRCNFDKMRLGKRRALLSSEQGDLLLQLFEADMRGMKPFREKELLGIKKLYEDDRGAVKKLQADKPLLSGEDVMRELGLEPGKQVGEILAKLKEAQYGGEIRTKGEAVTFVEKLK